MNRRWIGIAAAAAVVVGVLLWWAFSGGDAEDLNQEGTGEALTSQEQTDETVEQAEFDLYFPGEGGRLYAEGRRLPLLDDPTAHIAGLVDALLAGPESTSLRSPLSDGARLRQVYLMAGGAAPSADQNTAAEVSQPPSLGGRTVVLDFETEGGLPPRSTGSQRERLMVYSLVNTVLLNTDGGRGVLVLWNGQQNVTFGGHLDTGRPLAADVSLVANQEPPPYDPSSDDYAPSFFPAPQEDAGARQDAAGDDSAADGAQDI